MAPTPNQFKLTWDSKTSDYLLPVGTEAQKATVIKLDSKNEAEELAFYGYGYFCKVNDNHWVIGASELQLKPPICKLPSGKMVDGQYKADAAVEQAWLQAVEHNNFCYAACVDGNAGAEKLVELLDGKLAILDFKLLTKDPEKVEQAVKDIIDESEPETGVFSEVFAVLSEEEYEGLKDRKGKPIKQKPIIENGKPIIIPFLPTVKSSGGSKSGYGSKPGYLPTAERVKELLSFKDNADFEALYQWFTEDAGKVNFALALTGANPIAITNAITVPTATIEVPEMSENEVKEEVTEKK